MLLALKKPLLKSYWLACKLKTFTGARKAHASYEVSLSYFSTKLCNTNSYDSDRRGKRLYVKHMACEEEVCSFLLNK